MHLKIRIRIRIFKCISYWGKYAKFVITLHKMAILPFHSARSHNGLTYYKRF